MMFKALLILLCFVVMFGCLDARPMKKDFLPGKKRSSERSASPTTNAKPAEGKRTTKKKQSAEKEVENCTICQENLLDGKPLKELKKCEHKFHSDCINEWLQFNNNNSCPICRTKVSDTDLEVLGGRIDRTNENEQQTTQHPPHIITDETQTFPQNPWHIATSRENGGWEPYGHLLNGYQHNNGHDQSYYGDSGPQHFWDQAQNQRQSNIWEEQYLQEQNYGQQNQGLFNDNYNAADFVHDGVTAIYHGVSRVLSSVAGNLFGTQDSDHMGTSQSVYGNPLYHDHHMGTSQTYDNPLYHAGPSQTTFGQPAPGQVVHAPHCPHHHQPNCPHHQPPHFPYHHPTK